MAVVTSGVQQPREDRSNQTIEMYQSELDEAISRTNAALQDLGAKIAAIEGYIDGHADLELSDIGVALLRAKEGYDTLDKGVKRLYHFKDKLDKHVLPTRMTDAGLEMFRVPSIARSFSTVEKTSASFIDKEKGFEWLREIGQGDIVQETVNAGTLAAFCRNLVLEHGQEPPEDIVKMSSYSVTSITKYRPK